MFDQVSQSIDDLGNGIFSALNNIQKIFGKEFSVPTPIKENIFQLVGNTPLIRLNKIGSHLPKKNFYLKAEFLNPTGSIKDRTALAMILDAERRQILKHGSTLYLVGAKTTQLSLAWAGKARGFSVEAIVTPDTDPYSAGLLQRYGAKVTVLEKELFDEKIKEWKSFSKTGKGFLPEEDSSMANPNFHYRTTGPEIYRDLMGKVDAFVSGGGSGGTLSGIGRYLKSQNSSIQIVLSVLPHTKFHRYLIDKVETQLPEIFDPKIVDKAISTTKDQALRYQSELYEKEGILAGYTTGLTLAGAIHYAESLPSELAQEIVVLSPDRT